MILFLFTPRLSIASFLSVLRSNVMQLLPLISPLVFKSETLILF